MNRLGGVHPSLNLYARREDSYLEESNIDIHPPVRQLSVHLYAHRLIVALIRIWERAYTCTYTLYATKRTYSPPLIGGLVRGAVWRSLDRKGASDGAD